MRKSGDKLRITAQLVRASDSSHLWSQTYDRQMTDVFVVQDEIAAAVVNATEDQAARRGPEDANDGSAGLRTVSAGSRDYASPCNSAPFEQAIALYQQALAIDPNYAPAWDGLAETHFYQVDYGGLTSEEGLSLAREAIGRALTIDPGMPRLTHAPH